MTGTIVREIRFQCLLIEIGMTGWKFSVYLKPSLLRPPPHSKLFWKGTLISAATGFCSFLASSAASSSSPSTANAGGVTISIVTSAASARRSANSDRMGGRLADEAVSAKGRTLVQVAERSQFC